MNLFINSTKDVLQTTIRQGGDFMNNSVLGMKKDNQKILTRVKDSVLFTQVAFS